MGQRYLQLETSYTAYSQNSSAILHVRQIPPNPALLAPGPAFVFVVVAGVPSIGAQVMIGSGKLGTQTMVTVGDLPQATVVPASTGTQGSANRNAASPVYGGSELWRVTVVSLLAVLLFQLG